MMIGSNTSSSRACALCRRRKIRCNREAPCSNCLRSRANCVYQKSSGPWWPDWQHCPYGPGYREPRDKASDSEHNCELSVNLASRFPTPGAPNRTTVYIDSSQLSQVTQACHSCQHLEAEFKPQRYFSCQLRNGFTCPASDHSPECGPQDTPVRPKSLGGQRCAHGQYSTTI